MSFINYNIETGKQYLSKFSNEIIIIQVITLRNDGNTKHRKIHS
jgi:hypothetical protein